VFAAFPHRLETLIASLPAMIPGFAAPFSGISATFSAFRNQKFVALSKILRPLFRISGTVRSLRQTISGPCLPPKARLSFSACLLQVTKAALRR